MIANRTTTVSSEKSVAEIQAMLASIRACSLMIEYTDGRPSSIAFQVNKNGQSISFRLPSNWEGMFAALKREKGIPKRLLTQEHAQRVAWRVIRDWLRAQLTLIEAGIATVEEVMLPWAITSNGSSLSVRVLSGSTGLLGLPAPK